jgi:hypothetical protein
MRTRSKVLDSFDVVEQIISAHSRSRDSQVLDVPTPPLLQERVPSDCLDPSAVEEALELKRHYGMSFWDAYFVRLGNRRLIWTKSSARPLFMTLRFRAFDQLTRRDSPRSDGWRTTLNLGKCLPSRRSSNSGAGRFATFQCLIYTTKRLRPTFICVSQRLTP